MTDTLSFLDATERVLTDRGEAMHYRDITGSALSSGFLKSRGKTPERSLITQVSMEIKNAGEDARFLRVKPGVFALRRWLEDGTLAKDAVYAGARPMVPHFPEYCGVRDLLPVWDGVPDGAITRMRSRLADLRGTPQEQVDWTDPDAWIEVRLDGEAREWARRTWQGTAKRVSPRYVTGHWLLIRNYELLGDDEGGHLRLTKSGHDFLDEPEGETVRLIDREQGLLRILRMVAEAGGAMASELLDGWFDFLHAETNVRADSAAKSHLSHRFRNLLERGLVSRSGRSYGITSNGLQYLENTADSASSDEPEADLTSEIRRLQDALRQDVRASIKDLLFDMDPYAFERVIQRLLDEMGYQDTETTMRSGDGGVDVLGSIKVGITEIKEVVQAKRQQGNVGREVLDKLRGALYRFDAVQGTIITTAGFSSGARAVAFDRGAPPITLIDGDTLVSLLIEHGIGVDKRKIELWSLDPSAFVDEADEDESEGLAP